MLKKIFLLYACSFLISLPLFADETVVTINEGEPAPFTGTLFSTEAAAKLLIDLEFTQETCQIEIDRQLGLQSAQFQLQVDNITAEKDFCESTSNDLLAIKSDQIDFLTDQLEKSTSPRATWVFASGVVAGIALVAVTGWTMGQITQ